MDNNQEVELIINIMDSVLRKKYSIEECKTIILTFTFIKRIDCLLEYSKNNIIKTYEKNQDNKDIEQILISKSLDDNRNELGFYNYSKFNFSSLTQDSQNIRENMLHYIDCFSDNIKNILYNLDIKKQITTLSESNLLFHLINEFSKEIDLSLSNITFKKMGNIFEKLIVIFSQKIDGKSDQFYTPQDITKLMSELLFIEDYDLEKNTKTIYDPACGFGSMLIHFKKVLEKNKSNTNIELYGQDIDKETYALCKANMVINGIRDKNIKGPSSSLSEDKFENNKFDYMISNPPFGYQWQNDEKIIYEEKKIGFDGRFGAGLPNKNDGEFLFIQNMISKMKPNSKSRIAVITSERPLYKGNIGSGESEIRKWIIENDYLESIIALPKELFHNTIVNTYIWILTNQKSDKRKGKVQLVDVCEEFYEIKNPKSYKKNKLTKKLLNRIINDYKKFKNNNYIKIFYNEEFGYKEITVKEKNGEILENKKIPINIDLNDYLNNNILNTDLELEIDYKTNKIGYAINFKRLMFDEKIYLGNVKYPVLHLENIAYLKSVNSKNLNKFDIIIEYHNEKIAFYPHEISSKYFNNKFGCEIKTDKILKDYLYYYLNSNKGLKHVSYFYKNIRIGIDDLKYLPIPIPDIETQKRIIETCRLMDNFFNEMNIWKNEFSNDILNYEPTLEAYKEFSCSISFKEDGDVKEFCRNWRIVYQGLIWPLAYTYLKATRGSKNESIIKHNYIVLFEFLAAFNVIILISAISENDEISEETYKDIKNILWELNNNNMKTWHMMHFGEWTTLYKRLKNIYKDYDFKTSINRDFLVELSSKKYEKLFQKLRYKERNKEAHGGLEDDIDVKTKLDDLKTYVETDIFNILNLYSGYKLYYIKEYSNIQYHKENSYEVISLNGPCNPPIWYTLKTKEKLDLYCLYLHDPLNNSFLKINEDLMIFKQNNSNRWEIYLYDSVDTRKNIIKYKCYNHKNEILEIDLNKQEEDLIYISDEFLEDVLRLKRENKIYYI